jgi:hypothetical protein
MTPRTQTLQEAASRLHRYLVTHHWNGHALQGPDSGVRLNFRIGRFVKSYLDGVRWGDEYVYLQTQGYWIVDNWLLADLLHDEACEHLALSCAEYVLDIQRPGGYWEYPNPEWKGRIATVEGNFAALGLLESYARTGEERFLAGAKAWHRYLIEEVGFQGSDGLLAINYFSNLDGGMVPNNTALTLRLVARLAEVTGDDGYLAQAPGMVAWLRASQVATGELPYVVASGSGRGRPHFLCYQYNAFQLLDLAAYYRQTRDHEILPVISGLAAFLLTGVGEDGAARFNCKQARPETPYYTAVVARALSEASRLGVGDYRLTSERAYRRLLSLQAPDGRIAFFSRGNYRWLTDRRPYPRNLSMILYHLLTEVEAGRDEMRPAVETDSLVARGGAL